MATESAPRAISDILSQQDRQNIREIFSAAARDILYVADTDLRHQTEADWHTVQDIRSAVVGETAWNDTTKKALRDLQDIIESDSHTMLGKVYAGFAVADVIYAAGGLHDPSFTAVLTRAIKKTGNEKDSVLLTAALYSRYMALVMTHAGAGNNQDIIRKFSEELLGRTQTPLAARRYEAVQAAAETYASTIREDALDMRLPEAELQTALTENATRSEQTGYMIPESVMYLGPGRLVSWDKLIEAVQFGIPGYGVPEQRLPSLLVGVEIPVGQQTHERSKTKLGYVAMRALRRPRHGRVDWTRALDTEMRGSFGDEKLYQHCSFDTLSLIAAVRIARELTMENTPAGFTATDIAAKVRTSMKHILTVYPTAFSRDDSILSAALRESQRIDGSSDWTMTDAARHLESQITGLVVADISRNTVVWRNEAELWNLYLTHVVENELTREDKLEMVQFLLKDPQHELWKRLERTLDKSTISEIVSWVHNGHDIRYGLGNTLTGFVEKYIVQRCETIRDITVPLPLAVPVEDK